LKWMDGSEMALSAVISAFYVFNDAFHYLSMSHQQLEFFNDFQQLDQWKEGAQRNQSKQHRSQLFMRLLMHK